ncbi:4007_t:CDS:2 [Diversispora eburnea]|uniref:Phospholipid scramblase n=1 Tax=Diversispora eburnea TaxID=1213867 RepID=A0A9N9BBI0_9GLOM|nr:4007_t:CDS:2 [Diversispora eburnea]
MLFNILQRNNYSSRNLQILLNPIFITFLHKTPKRPFSTKSIQGITEKTRNLLSNIRNNREKPNNVNNANIEKTSIVSQPQEVVILQNNNNKPHEILTFSDSASQILRNSALIVARQVELLNVFLNQICVGYIAEEQTFTSTLLRQLFRTHRNFRATILNPNGEIILKIHRPFAFINSRIFVSTNDNQLIGEVQQQWHLWHKRGVDFGSVNRNFGGFAKEIFTDMGQYVIRMDPETRLMSLDERAVILAAAISVDFDYFSRHSRHGGGGLFHLPILDDLQGRNSNVDDDKELAM